MQTARVERRAILVEGTVQGVGFRPFVYGIAAALRLGGFVRNLAGSVQIEVEGESGRVDQFVGRIVRDAPPLARITDVGFESRMPLGEDKFRIGHSESSVAGPVVIAPDVGTCNDCLAELFDPGDGRFGYPFLNCTNCGPRLTIVTGAPYDRHRTTMAGFTMCPACRAEYEDPTNRRFHAQPTACPLCGPKLTAMDTRGRVLETADPLGMFVVALQRGEIGAMKGLGGFHLICDARNVPAVNELRRRKHRDEKPFAVMVADLESAKALCDIDAAEESLLTSSRRPIVLLKKKTAVPLAAEVAPNNPQLGVMLPYTPLHHLLLRAMAGAPLVMTSGNQSDEPIAIENSEAIESLKGIADLFLVHDRPIHVRCDDSVTRIIGGVESPVRRSRGYAPQPIALAMDCPMPILAVGGQLKATFALASGSQTVISHHLGDLDHFKAFRAFERDIKLYERLFQIEPRCIVHDLHPDYASTRYAIQRAREQNLRPIAVQHHHAHMASCMAENGLNERVIGVSFDGTGFGLDGAIWGGEFLVGDFKSFKRAAHLRYVAMPGGERAIREPWRMAVAHLLDAQAYCAVVERRIPAASVHLMHTMIDKRLNSPMTSSAGRLFDAVASLIGVRDQASYEGQAAMQLEWLASSAEMAGTYPFELNLPPNGDEAPIVVDTRPMIAAICRDINSDKTSENTARQFQSTMTRLITDVCIRLRNASGLDGVVLSGGTFMNALLSTEASELLQREGFRVYRHQSVPPNDGGLCLGQLAVAASQLAG
jgi:hydrogenase maturation protein HypF